MSSGSAGKLADQVLEVVARAGGRLEPGGDADGERVAADAGEMLAEQVSGSHGLAGGKGVGRVRQGKVVVNL
jgi:hypothetical protein